MGRSYTIRTTHVLGTPSQVDERALETTIDFAIPLSQRLQRNVRQGHNFKVKSLQASLAPMTVTGSQDIGVSFMGAFRYAPCTKASASAWRTAFHAFRKQKALAVNRIGPHVRYDDFEVAWDSDNTTSRTSRLFTGGMGDETQEAVTIYGTSTDDEDVSLSDIYNSLNPVAQPARFPTSDAIVKESKYQVAFPDIMKQPFSCNASAVFGSFGTEPDSGTFVDSPKVEMNHDVLCGVVYVDGFLLPENTVSHLQDEYYLTLIWEIEIGTPLIKTRSLKSKYKKRGGRKYRSKRSRKR